jgi:hypothetical protein
MEKSDYYDNIRKYFESNMDRYLHTFTEYKLQLYSENNKYFTRRIVKYFGIIESERYSIETVLEHLPQIINMFTINGLYVRYNIIKLSCHMD